MWLIVSHQADRGNEKKREWGVGDVELISFGMCGCVWVCVRNTSFCGISGSFTLLYLTSLVDKMEKADPSHNFFSCLVFHLLGYFLLIYSFLINSACSFQVKRFTSHNCEPLLDLISAGYYSSRKNEASGG